MRLNALQRQLVASLAGGAAPPDACEPAAIRRAARALTVKRQRAAAQLLPRARAALGTAWAGGFSAHAARYAPAGLLFHVDDAWAFARELKAHADPAVRAAAHDDLLALRLRWERQPGASAHRVRERRWPLVGIRREPRALIVRLPGSRPRYWSLPL